MNREHILISSAGRRSGLIACFRDSVARRGEQRRIYTADLTSSAPAAFLGDGNTLVPRCTRPEFLEEIFALCDRRGIGLVVPTIDTELLAYAEAAPRFREAGIEVNISSPEMVRIGCDKIATHRWLTENGFPTVRQTDPATALAEPGDWPLPLLAKPAGGSASIGIRRIASRGELETLAATTTGYIVQEIAQGREYTVNAYVGRQGRLIASVPHLRLEVRAGEVSKAVTVKDKRLMELARAIAETLPGARGAFNLQLFLDETGRMRVIEMNARFGGGYPLAHHAGARFSSWLLEEQEGRTLEPTKDWIDDLAMLRFDDAIYLPGGKIRS